MCANVKWGVKERRKGFVSSYIGAETETLDERIGNGLGSFRFGLDNQTQLIYLQSQDIPEPKEEEEKLRGSLSPYKNYIVLWQKGKLEREVAFKMTLFCIIKYIFFYVMYKRVFL